MDKMNSPELSLLDGSPPLIFSPTELMQTQGLTSQEIAELLAKSMNSSQGSQGQNHNTSFQLSPDLLVQVGQTSQNVNISGNLTARSTIVTTSMAMTTTTIDISESEFDSPDFNAYSQLTSDSFTELWNATASISEKESQTSSQVSQSSQEAEVPVPMELEVKMDVETVKPEAKAKKSVVRANKVVVAKRSAAVEMTAAVPGTGIHVPNEGICYENYPGDYNFNVVPKVGLDANKLRYHEESKNLYCKLGTHDFVVKMDFKKIKSLGGMAVQAVIVFTEPEHKDKAVVKCLNCFNDEVEINRGESEEYMYHILRAPKEDRYAQYVRSEATGRFYMIFPVIRPQAGCGYVTQSIQFSCLTSCKSPGMHRRPSCIIFSLMDDKDVVRGRVVMALRVCTNPNRDYELAFKQEKTIKQEVKSKAVAVVVNKLPLKPRVSTSKKEETPPKGPLVSEDFVFDNSQEQLQSSQESVFSDCDDDDLPVSSSSIRLRRLYKDARVVLRMKRSRFKNRRIMAHNLFSTLKMAHSICAMARQDVAEEMKLNKEAQKKGAGRKSKS